MQTETKCLNCGADIFGDYCHRCGQAAATRRLSTKTFIAEIFAGLTRINRGFLYTCWCLLSRPWQVIADYIHGRRRKYTGPVQLLILLCFFLFGFFPLLGLSEMQPENDRIFIADDNKALADICNNFAHFLLSTPSLMYLLMFIPAIPALKWIFRHEGSRRFNMAEYFLAAIYMSDAVLVVELIAAVFDTITMGYMSWVCNLYIAALGIISIFKAFPCRGLSWWTRVEYLMVFLMTMTVLYLLLFIALGAFVAMIYSGLKH